MMRKENVCPDPVWEAGAVIGEFRILRVAQLPDIRVTAYEIIHERTGAQVLHLHCDDRENLYAIGFRTPPGDSTGLPHILEHSVLAGSLNYPVKDAFNELHRSTLQTFINAFTYPDKTIYPVASQIKADFYNLARVYTDLVLRPRLLSETFRQEGHHLEFAVAGDISSDLTISGIVYNEMKGAYSSPDNLMFKALQENLMPDTVYRFDSGGAPEIIPTLTYEAFVAFHQSYYSPSNARVFLYGNIPTADHLAFLEEMFTGFDRVTVDSAIVSQKRWTAPRQVRHEYPIAKDEDPKRRAAVNVAWMLSENTDELTSLLLQITAGILVGSAAGPLRKALIDSRLGEDLSPVTGFERDFKQTIFAVGLRGTEVDKGAEIEALILNTLDRVAREGIDRDLIEGTLHQVEFGGKEISRSNFPYGIVLMGWVYHTWLYGGDPLNGLNFPAFITEVRRMWQETPDLFERMIREWLIDNPHRLLSVMAPNVNFLEEREEQFRSKMVRTQESLDADKMADIDREAADLKVFQAEADTPEAIASLPKLKIADIERQVEAIPTAKGTIGGVPVLYHDIFTNGIAYIDLAFDISHISDDLQPYLPMLGKLMTNMGAAGLDYEAMSKHLALKTGGVGIHLMAGNVVGENRPWQKMIVRLKSLYRNIPDAVSLLGDILTEGDLTDLKRMEDLLVEKKNRLHAAIVPSGHLFARRLAASSFSVAARRDEQWHGKTQLQFLNAVVLPFQKEHKDLVVKIAQLKESILNRGGLSINLTADADGLTSLEESAVRLAGRLAAYGETAPLLMPSMEGINRGVTLPAQVSYVAEALPAPGYGDPVASSLLVLSRFLSTGYLYKTIRVQGGAYGGMSLYDPMDGVFAFLSYRDPHIVRTLQAYQEAIDLVCRGEMETEEIEKAIIGTIGALDRPTDPSGKASVAMTRHFAGITDAYRQNLRDEILGMTAEKISEASCRFFESAKAKSVIVVYGEDGKLRRANEQLGGRLEIETL
ncbi:MAG: hypothetical protein CSYNP_00277 [Syntrophus sp. SKADARSKE-3]|nr:hypothetical protein [Syntrophus sp. SKADARSKE-3]